ncbi:MAG: hypothetical protein KC800_00275 [Candidatus Eremiobacteraeota bacterium]|nr:hypothetical protein [Candidatus Eremiobacteraeota bacterium]
MLYSPYHRLLLFSLIPITESASFHAYDGPMIVKLFRRTKKSTQTPVKPIRSSRFYAKDCNYSESLVELFNHLEDEDNPFIHRPLGWWACNDKVTLSTRWTKREGVDSLRSTLKVRKWSQDTRLKWARQLTVAFSSIDSKFPELLRDFQAEIDAKGNCLLNVAGCIYQRSRNFNRNNAVILEHEDVVWAFSHNFSEKWRKEFLSQYWLGTRLYQILTCGARPYLEQLKAAMRFLASGGTSELPRYTEPSGLSSEVSEVLRKMLSFDDGKRYGTLAEAVAAMSWALGKEHAQILVSQVQAA